MTTIFSYGTLRCPQVRQALLLRNPEVMEGVIVKGFKIHPVTNNAYPGVVESSDPNDIVNGTLIYGITEPEMGILDLFEDEYVKKQISVHSILDSPPTFATIYVWNESHDRLDMTREWSFENDYLSQEEGKQRFVDNAVEFRGLALSKLSSKNLTQT